MTISWIFIRINHTNIARWIAGDEDWVYVKRLYPKATATPKYLSRATIARANPLNADLYIYKERNKGRIKKTMHVEHLQIKYRNNRLEAEHGKLKRLISPVRGFQSMKTAYATIKGFEIMRMFKTPACKAGALPAELRPLFYCDLLFYSALHALTHSVTY